VHRFVQKDYYYLHPTFKTIAMEFLIQGSKGSSVLLLQQILHELGYNVAENGIFCEQVTQSIVEFQKSVSIQPNGTVDDITWAFLMNVREMKNRAKANSASSDY
jgi:peptidoglycan hydrolase-like protein with peptidoglycan-binding domain